MQHLKNVPILIFANKQDVKGALSEEDIAKEYSLHEIKEHSWHLQLCSAVEGWLFFNLGKGVKEGLDWLTEQLANNQEKWWVEKCRKT